MIEISAERLVQNVAAIRARVGPGFEVLGVIKADAYGHGAALCAGVLADEGIRWLGVGDTEEGRRVREALRSGRLTARPLPPGREEAHVLVMCGFEPNDATEILAAHLTPVVWTLAHLRALERAAARLPLPAGQPGAKPVAVHVEIDSGMARQGVVPGPELQALLDSLARSPWLQCEGVFSHLSSSEEVCSAETASQCDQFAAALQQVRDAGLRPRFVHLGNSSAIDEGQTLAWVEAQALLLGARPMVRPGLALYGYCLPLSGSGGQEDGTPEAGLVTGLQPVASWTAEVIGLREIAAGQPVGYGATFVARRPLRLALLPVGYADGFRREASSGAGNGWVLIGGVRAPVVGRVSMNLLVVDITDHAARGVEVGLGAQAVLLGEGVSAEDHARWAHTIPYEILCGMRGHRRLRHLPESRGS